MADASEGQHPNGTLSSSSTSPRSRLSFESLPPETQREIVKHISKRHLASLQRVSKHFHELASAKLYGLLTFELTADVPINSKKGSGRLAEALHTFAVSEHDYAQYVKAFYLGFAAKDGEEIQKRIASKYHYEEETTKLLNTALLLMLRKAKVLDTFAWDVSIELSPSIYATLAKTPSLQYVRIKLDAASVPRIPMVPTSSSSHHHPPPGHHPPVFAQQPPQLASSLTSSSSNISVAARAHKPSAHPKHGVAEKRRFSGLGRLKQLDIIGIEDLECIPEIAACLLACSATLVTLKLSLSHDLARKARKPSSAPLPVNLVVDPMDDDDDDDLTQPDEPPASVPPVPVNEADIRKEKSAQESILAEIFSLQKHAPQDRKVEKILLASSARSKSKKSEEALLAEALSHLKKTAGSKNGDADRHRFIGVMTKLMQKWNDSKSKGKKKAPAPSKATAKAGPDAGAVGAALNAPDLFSAGNIPEEFINTFGSPTPPKALVEEYVDAFGAPSTKALNATHNPPAFGGGSFPPLGASGPSASASSLFGNAPTHYFAKSTSSPFENAAGLGPPSSNAPVPSLWPASATIPPASLEGSFPSMMTSMLDKYPVPVQKKGLGKIKYYGEEEEQAEEDIEADDSAEDADDKEASDTGDEPAVLFPAAVAGTEDKEDDMDVDMEHPDVDDSANEEDADVVDEAGLDTEDTSTARESATEADAAPESHPAPAIATATTAIRANGLVPSASSDPHAASAEETMQSYIRSKHGFRIETLALHLIPLKASVLGRALDLSYLTSIALLNVGSQAGFWTLLDKLHGDGVALQLRSIHTDDVTTSFLGCVGHLSGLTDLFLMKRSTKESSASSKNTASIGDIRELVLHKHITTLKRLMIMNMNYDDMTWDLDVRCLRLVATQGYHLTELAISVALDDYHVLMQALPGLQSLVALHVIALRNIDTCAAVIRECRRFTIDNISHHPELQIRYLAMQSAVYQLIRHDPSLPLDPIDGAMSKGKGKASAVEVGPLAPETSTAEGGLVKSGLHLTHVKLPSRFWEVQGIKIFEKSIRLGKL